MKGVARAVMSLDGAPVSFMDGMGSDCLVMFVIRSVGGKIRFGWF